MTRAFIQIPPQNNKNSTQAYAVNHRAKFSSTPAPALH
jgi:hypothetical protein